MVLKNENLILYALKVHYPQFYNQFTAMPHITSGIHSLPDEFH